jgi:hypothetical protein
MGTLRRGARPFPRTPVSMQPLSLGLPPAASIAAAGSAATPAGSSSSPAPDQAPTPAPLTWTPMRSSQAHLGMQPRVSPSSLRSSGGGFGGFGAGLKRGRGAEGTPLLGAGLAGDAERRTRQRGEQVCSAASSTHLHLPSSSISTRMSCIVEGWAAQVKGLGLLRLETDVEVVGCCMLCSPRVAWSDVCGGQGRRRCRGAGQPRPPAAQRSSKRCWAAAQLERRQLPRRSRCR